MSERERRILIVDVEASDMARHLAALARAEREGIEVIVVEPRRALPLPPPRIEIPEALLIGPTTLPRPKQLPLRVLRRPSRNAPCACGSGRKSKKCCEKAP